MILGRAFAAAFAFVLFLVLHDPAGADDSARVALVERVSRSVVHVKAEPRDPPEVSRSEKGKSGGLDEFFEKFGRPESPRKQEGSGFVVDAERGLILTAAHIAAESKSLSVVLPGGEERPAKLAGIDPDGGLALLQVEGLGLPALTMGPRAARAGETAVIVGWMIPLKAIMPVQGMVMGPAPGVSGEALAPPFADYVALDSAIPNGGFGGGPVIAEDGTVIGMVSAILGRGYGAGSLTLMIPAPAIAPLVEELAAKGRVVRSRIGIETDCDPPPCAITAVDSGSPAETAGIRAGDRLLIVDRSAAESDPQVRRLIGTKPVGSMVALTLWRDGQEIRIAVPTVER